MFLSSLLRIKFVSVAEDKEQCASPVPIGFFFTGNETLCAARRRQQAAQPHRARFLGGFLVAQIVATFHGRAGAAISIRGLCCSFHLWWALEPMCSESKEARKKSSDEGSEVTGPKRNRTPTCRG